MALDEFWRNLKLGASHLWPNVRAQPPLNENALTAIVRGAELWLVPQWVEGFDVNDFDFLTSAQREELRQGVADFRRVAELVPPRGPATIEQSREGLEALRRILDILRPDQYPDVDAFRAAKVLQNLQLPEDLRENVDRIIERFDLDGTGDTGIWIWVILKDDILWDQASIRDRDRISRSIEAALRRHHIAMRPYIHFRSFSEQRDVELGLVK